MKPIAYITTSWDDGHPLDLRVAELLAKYNLAGTFYVPRHSEYGTMTAAQLVELSSAFEVGAHTIDHVVLPTVSDERAWQEIADSKAWLEDNLGVDCPMFCPPGGRYSHRHLELAQRAGFVGVRTAEPLSLDFPRMQAGLLVMPTTIHAHTHSLLGHAKYVIGWSAFRNLWMYVLHGRTTDWATLARSLLCQARKRGGVFHLWGHAWELDRHGQWQRLEEVLRFLSEFTTETPALANGQVCHALSACAVGGGLP